MKLEKAMLITISFLFVFFLIYIFYIVSTAAPPEPQETATETAPEPELMETVYYDVPLSNELQAYTQGICERYGVDYRLVLALMWRESNFDVAAISSTGCYGLMQLNVRYYPEAQKLDTLSNIRAGVALLSSYLLQYGDIEMALIAYNMGAAGARKLFCNGIYSTGYSRSIIDYMDKLTVRERIYEEAAQ